MQFSLGEFLYLVIWIRFIILQKGSGASDSCVITGRKRKHREWNVQVHCLVFAALNPAAAMPDVADLSCDGRSCKQLTPGGFENGLNQLIRVVG
jgi:hypothetical protein